MVVRVYPVPQKTPFVTNFRLCGLAVVVVENARQYIPISHGAAGFKDRSGYGDRLIDTSRCLFDPDLFVA